MSYKGDKLADGTPLNQAVYRAFRNGGLSHNQALAITAEVGRENGFQAKYIFGGHIDPAGAKGGGTIQNTGFLSWNGNRGANLRNYLSQAGVWGRGGMARTQEALDAQARFAIQEMKGAYKGKLQHFWANPNADPDSFARELGKGYIVWAYGQNTIRGKSGGRVPFAWKAHDNRRRGYLMELANAVGGGGNYKPSTPMGQNRQSPQMAQQTAMGNLRGVAQNTPQSFAPQQITGDRLQQLLRLNGIGTQGQTAPQPQTPTFAPQQITGDRLQQLLKMNGVANPFGG